MSVTVIGLDGAALTPDAARCLGAATLVVGGSRNLSAVDLPSNCRRIVLGTLAPAVQALHAHDGPAVVLASGDPGFFGIVRTLRENGIQPRVLPAVSSVQRAFAAIGRSWDDVSVVSAHGRDLRQAANVCRARAAVAVLTAPGAGPAELAVALQGWERTLVIAEDLGGPDERISVVSRDEAAAGAWREPNVVLCLTFPGVTPPLGWVSGGERPPSPAHIDPEVVASICAHLDPRPGQLVWAIGARAPAVAAGCVHHGAAALLASSGPVIPEDLGAAAVGVRVVHEAVTASLPEPDAIYLGRADPALLPICASSIARRVVIALNDAASLDRTRAALQGTGFAVQVRQVAVSEVGSELSDEPPARTVATLLVATR